MQGGDGMSDQAVLDKRVPERPKKQGGDYSPHYPARQEDEYVSWLVGRTLTAEARLKLAMILLDQGINESTFQTPWSTRARSFIQACGGFK